jgi:hypothetical protein
MLSTPGYHPTLSQLACVPNKQTGQTYVAYNTLSICFCFTRYCSPQGAGSVHANMQHMKHTQSHCLVVIASCYCCYSSTYTLKPGQCHVHRHISTKQLGKPTSVVMPTQHQGSVLLRSGLQLACAGATTAADLLIMMHTHQSVSQPGKT